jgi:hypothetical protein
VERNGDGPRGDRSDRDRDRDRDSREERRYDAGGKGDVRWGSMWALANDNMQFLWVKHEVKPIVKGMMMMTMMIC